MTEDSDEEAIEQTGLLPESPPEAISPMQQSVLDSGLVRIDGFLDRAFKTNEGTVFLASPADINRLALMNHVHVERGPTYLPTNAEIDRLMKED